MATPHKAPTIWPPGSHHKTIQARWTRHAGHCWRSKDELISDVLLWIPTYGQAKAGWPAWTYIQQLCEDTGCSLEDLPEAMNDREKWRERVRDICASGTTWWWWWWCLYLCTCTEAVIICICSLFGGIDNCLITSDSGIPQTSKIDPDSINEIGAAWKEGPSLQDFA